MKRVLPAVVLSALVLVCAVAAAQSNELHYATTYTQPSGNRLAEGSGTFPDVVTIDVPLGSLPAWVVGLADGGNLLLTTVLDDSTTHQVVIREGTADGRAIAATPDSEPAPPILVADSDTGVAVAVHDLSPWTHPVPFGGGQLYVMERGELALARPEAATVTLPVRALRDARIALSVDGQAAVYTGESDRRYLRGALGDIWEANSLTVVEMRAGALEQVAQITLTTPEVFEGIMPFWADVDANGEQDLVTTVSALGSGTRVRVYRADGGVLAQGPAFEEGMQWRHPIAFAPFGPDGAEELAVVRAPYTDGVVEFYRLDNRRLEIVAERPGYRSHRFGSRNVDMAVAGDFNGDGVPEVVLPDETQTRLNGLQRTATGIEVVWSLPLDGTLTANLAAITLEDGRLALVSGVDSGGLRVWISHA